MRRKIMKFRAMVTLIAGILILGACADPASQNQEDDTADSAASAEFEDQESGDSSLGADDTAPATELTSTTHTGDEPVTPESSETAPPEETTSTTRPIKEPDRVPDDTTPPITGETPADLLAQIIADAADRAGVDDSAVAVIRDEFAIWNDGSLGCAKPGEVYTQASVDGYWVVLEAAGTEYDYRANTEGYFKLCEGDGLRTNPTG
jgi:hypothetical protein